MVLHESADTCHGEIHDRIPECLPKLIRIPREEIAERTKEIHAFETIRYVGTEADATHRSADLPKMFSPRARVRIAGLIMVFAAFAVSRIGPPERDQSSNVNLRAGRLIRAQDRTARGGLKPQIAYGLRT